jgi:hypothetical protein
MNAMMVVKTAIIEKKYPSAETTIAAAARTTHHSATEVKPGGRVNVSLSGR